ncbi:MAG TPA: cobalamin-dependent protein [Solirubrobacteraceae bacterium]|nr:cobalamin-dependent protein [Solirubrobacteraceae bacterium]
MSTAEYESPRASAQELRASFLDCLIAPDARGARIVIDDSLAAGTSAASLYLDVIGPAMSDVGRLWELAKISVAQEHLATQITQSVIATLGLHLRAEMAVGHGRVAVVASTPGERHSLGGQMVADFLEAQGWTTLALGPDAPLTDLVGFARDQRAELVALSTALARNLLLVTRTCGLLRRLDPPPMIVVGGQAYGGNAEQALAVGADAFADGPAALLDLLAVRFAPDAAD